MVNQKVQGKRLNEHNARLSSVFRSDRSALRPAAITYRLSYTGHLYVCEYFLVCQLCHFILTPYKFQKLSAVISSRFIRYF